MPLRLITSVTYVSTARAGLSLEEVLAILTVSRRNNRRFGITGLLVFNGINFMQCLEGDRAATKDRLYNIGLDERHSGLTVVNHHERSEPQFSGWDMAARYWPTDQSLGQADLVTILSGDTVSETTRALFQSFQSLGGGSAGR